MSDTPSALQPLSSLMSKSEKAMEKLSVGTWQHMMLRKNLRALQISSALIQQGDAGEEEFTTIELQDAADSLHSLISMSEKAQNGISRGTSQYSLLHNRIMALKAALAAVESAHESKSEDVTEQNK